ncbi:MAG: NAD(P)/FAD-dependent oxidoreductase [Chloroflexi bacterium]|nr:NAD(P)/FAD-dependent oxidoreductase [Chloroflexota bacterium]
MAFGPRATEIVVLGGGFGGVYTLIGLEKALRKCPGARITLVSNENFFLYTPLLHEVATGGIETRHIAYPIRRLFRKRHRFEFRMCRVERVDLTQRRVILDHGELSYDFLVLALGSTTNMTSLPGYSQNVFTLKNLLDGVQIRNHIIRMFETADCETDQKRQKQLLTFVVVGPGYTGVQLVADLRSFVRHSLLKKYPRIDPAMVRVMLIGDRGYILSGRDRKLGDASVRQLRKLGVEIRLNTQITRLWDHGMELDHMEMEPTETIIWAAGIVASPVVSAIDAEKDELGRIKVDRFLRVPGYPGVYALGDNAHFEDAATGAVLPPRAHYAVRQPKVVVSNILAELINGQPREYLYHDAAELVSLGPRNAVMNLYGFHISGLVARFIWLTGYLAIMMGLYNRTRVLLDWLLAMIFDRDSTLLDVKR